MDKNVNKVKHMLIRCNYDDRLRNSTLENPQTHENSRKNSKLKGKSWGSIFRSKFYNDKKVQKMS